MKKQARPNSCTVLSLDGERQELWSFATGSQKITLVTEKLGSTADKLPDKVVQKDWKTLVQPKLNLAWLPPHQVFLRVLHLPAADAAEVRTMIEFQLEKLSPLPVQQIVWSYEVLPQAAPNSQTVLLIVVARHVVEEFLGKLEAKGFLADRVELPVVPEMLAAPKGGDGVWLYPRILNDRILCLAAWWYGGILRELVFMNLPADAGAGPMLTEQLGNMAWSGELEGWLTSEPTLHIVAEPEVATQFKLFTALDASVDEIAPMPRRELAEKSARRAASGESRVNLLPPEHASRYKQQLIDRTWMRGLGAAVFGYVILVVLYLAGVEFVKFQRSGVEQEVATAGPSYTNALQLAAKVDVLQEQLALKFAALDAWKLVSMHLPSDLKLTSFSFSRGKTVSIFGEGPPDSVSQLTEYNRRLVNASITTNGQPFFSEVKPPTSANRGDMLSWSFTAEIRSSGE
jgi:hypothetical protein